jgi:uncharacterized protein (DUF302 family)
MNLNKLVMAAMLTMGVGLYAQEAQAGTEMLTAELYGSKGNALANIDAVLSNKIEDAGFSIVQANKDIQNFYYRKFKEKNVESISFYDVTNMVEMRKLLLKNPDFGAYAPFNVLVYKTLDTKNDDNTWYGHLAADTMLDVIGEKDPATRKAFSDMVAKLDTVIEKEMKPTESLKITHTTPLPTHGLTKMVKKFDTPDDMEEFIEEFVMDHDGRFSKHNFIIAGFKDFEFDYADMDLPFEKYDAYWVSLLCHFKFSNTIFNRGMPELGMFAPCSVYFYIPKGVNELHVGYASVYNWIPAVDLKDQEKIDYMKKIDAEVVETFGEMGFVLEVQK